MSLEIEEATCSKMALDRKLGQADPFSSPAKLLGAGVPDIWTDPVTNLVGAQILKSFAVFCQLRLSDHCGLPNLHNAPENPKIVQPRYVEFLRISYNELFEPLAEIIVRETWLEARQGGP
ncbi:hypothetical protein [Marivita geojedonensis]|uniref:hypothetical protein n=1 Tax=Marivita geojedonensis TaxID=1123756 RepID=UPI00117BEB0F|nr:hypothetical protein [Marivita geojedonensis]